MRSFLFAGVAIALTTSLPFAFVAEAQSPQGRITGPGGQGTRGYVTPHPNRPGTTLLQDGNRREVGRLREHPNHPGTILQLDRNQRETGRFIPNPNQQRGFNR